MYVAGFTINVLTLLAIVLATGLVVYVLLAAFVFRHDESTNTDGVKQKMSEAQKALGLGYAVPILATAVAIIFGLGVYDVTRTNLQVWVWVIIIAIVAAGVVWGTRFAAKAKSAKAIDSTASSRKRINTIGKNIGAQARASFR